ncbi:hypothetical protein [[Phormidium] sp. ETS-05]|uniref:hypothetical protein n=1 Tax=[Phormidium] sp. ETS-05 TaxID=222819 RepID=UPI0018EED7CF|nr:hypothetical protein [[Phormidium] sp. ETS-05]
MVGARRHRDIGETRNLNNAVPSMSLGARRYLNFGQPRNIKDAVPLQAGTSALIDFIEL